MDKILDIYEPILKKYFDDMDMSSFMIYMIDLVDPSALPYLAKQFNVDGYRGWDLATTDADRRELIKKGIYLISKVGTPWAIKNALKAIGFPNVVISERVSLSNFYDGTFTHNGDITYGGTGGSTEWVNFGVTISVADPTAITDDQKRLIGLLINEYKPARCVLAYLTFTTI